MNYGWKRKSWFLGYRKMGGIRICNFLRLWPVTSYVQEPHTIFRKCLLLGISTDQMLLRCWSVVSLWWNCDYSHCLIVTELEQSSLQEWKSQNYSGTFVLCKKQLNYAIVMWHEYYCMVCVRGDTGPEYKHTGWFRRNLHYFGKWEYEWF